MLTWKYKYKASDSWSTQWGLAFNSPMFLLVMDWEQNIKSRKKGLEEIFLPFVNKVCSSIYTPSSARCYSDIYLSPFPFLNLPSTNIYELLDNNTQ
jgi:hypothetical protein